MCNFKDCQTQPKFNNYGEPKGLYCGYHRKDGMINVLEKRKCIDCQKIPKFNNFGESKGLYCGDHIKDGMINVLEKRCKTNLCNTFVKKKYEGYCLRCYMLTYPDRPVSRNRKTKEKDIVDRIKSLFPDFDWKEDRKVSGGCSQKRPDLFLDMGSHVINVEIDENKHSSYDCICENKRMMEISQDIGGRPIIFIRFNPDGYEDVNGKKITSCWGLDCNNIMVLKKNKLNEWVERVNVLTNQIQHWVVFPTEKTIEIIQLFY